MTRGSAAFAEREVVYERVGKLSLNLLVGAMAQGLSESLAFLQSLGLSRELFLQALGTSAVRAPLRAGRAPRPVRRLRGPLLPRQPSKGPRPSCQSGAAGSCIYALAKLLNAS